MMRHLLASAVLCALAGAAHAQDEPVAQPRPLLDETLPEGTVAVQVVRGTVEKPLPGLLVTLRPQGGGKALSARTDSLGRASFARLGKGGSYAAEVTAGDVPLSSEVFTLPEGGGVRVLLSPVLIEAAAENTEAAGDSIPPMMRDPRRLSGQARPEAEDPAGTLTIRTVQGKFRSTDAGLISDFPKGTPVLLIGYAADGKTTFHLQRIGEDGRVRFAGLDKGKTAYYALSLFARKNGTTDRLRSEPVKMLPGTGMRMMLAGLALDDVAAEVDDVAGERQGSQPEAGQVNILIQASDDKKLLVLPNSVIELVAIGSDGERVIGRTAVREFRPEPTDVDGRYMPVKADQMKLANGTIGVGVFRPSQNQGLAGIPLEVRGKNAVAKGTTDERGFALFDADLKALAGQEAVVVATVFGKEISSDPVKVPGRDQEALGMAVVADWEEGFRSARFDNVPPAPDTAYYARLQAQGRSYRSLPFQVSPARGVAAQIRILPDVLIGFQGHGEMEDDKIWFQLRLILANPSDQPYLPEGGEVLVPLPEGFVGGSIQGEEMAEGPAKIVPGKGLIHRGVLAPGLNDVMIQFAVPVRGGTATVDWPLPYGVWQGMLMLREIPGMGLYRLAGGADVATLSPEQRQTLAVPTRKRDAGDGTTILQLDTIRIQPGQRFVLGIDNLPMRSQWPRVLRIGAGLAVVALLLWAFLTIVLKAQPKVAGAAYHESENLMDELVQLEKRLKKQLLSEEDYKIMRARLMQKLEELRGKERTAG